MCRRSSNRRLTWKPIYEGLDVYGVFTVVIDFVVMVYMKQGRVHINYSTSWYNNVILCALIL